MTRQQTAGDQGPATVEQRSDDAQAAGHASEQGASEQDASEQGGGRPGHGQSGGGTKGKSPIAVIAGQDGPQTGGHERGDPGVGG